jgi:acetyl-CoA carboxylase/biotin carboxylase 1
MYKNGVSHLTAQSDLEGALQIMQWLSYVPERKGKAIPIFPSGDSWDRPIGYLPPKGPYDPRWFIEGKVEETEGGGQEYLSGFFDKGSFQETLGGWAQTVVVGRARLGGIPMGVIAVETRTIEKVVPADPANPASFEQKIMEAGQVWYPNSAYKTAQAIYDMNREGLPLIIFANWRGFSGGQQDMVSCDSGTWSSGYPSADETFSLPVRRNSQTRFQDCRWLVVLQAARLCVHRSQRRASRRGLGRAGSIHQP